MAEPVSDGNSLDDFFAKKDKSKKKSKSTFTPSDILVKQNEKSKKGGKKREKEDSDRTGNATLNVKFEENPDEEWEDFERNDGEKDYTGLRIQNLQLISREGEEEKDKTDAHSGDEDGEGREGKEGPQGPWKTVSVSAGAVEPSAEPAPTPATPATPADKDAVKPTGKYVPPGARRAMAAGGASPTAASTGSRGMRGKKTAPNVNSVEEFPSLGGMSAEHHDSDQTAFEKVRSGGRQADGDPSQRQQKLELGNKFGALTDN